MFKKLALIIFGCSLLVYSFFQFQKSFLKIEDAGYTQFIAGNKLVENKKTEDALKEYSEAMDINEDINIKKNYEIALKILQEKQNESSENNKDSDKNNQKNEKDQNSNKEQNESEKDENSESKEVNNSSEAENSEKEKQKEDELKSIMQRLESNEKRAFKNNEKMLNNSENKDSENRW
ncbi:MAG: hypothetical protein ACRC0Y_10820 [Fusobacteriaceae bacterium]